MQIPYPTNAGQMLGRNFRDTKRLAACVRAYNNWACEYAAAAPERLRWATALPMQDIDEVIVEARPGVGHGAVLATLRPSG